MATSEEQLAELLKDAGTRLLSPPPSVDDLLPLLDVVERCLERVDQSPSQTMQDALSPSLKALVAPEILGHSDPDIKVYVATCISEITRITAPDAPYSDDQMKDIFQLIVSSFENLHDTSSRSYNKRTTILETVAKVRSCVVMLDLECDDLILQMFQHFLKSVRDYHPEKVFSSMERIMTLVLEESEDISPELLSSILEYLKKDDKNVHPIARRLGENVLNKCSSKVEPYLVQAIQTLGLSLDEYSNVVSSVCQELSGVVDVNGVNGASINSANQDDLPNPSSEDAVKEVKEALKDTASQTEVSPATDTLESTVSNGNLQKGFEEAEVVEEYLTAQKCDDHTENKAPQESDANKDEVELIIKPQPKGKSNKKRGRKRNLSKTTLEPSEDIPAKEGNDPEKVTDLQESDGKDGGSLHSKDTPADNTSTPNSDKGPDNPHPLSKASENKAVIPSPSPSGDKPKESHLKKVGRGNKTEAAIQEVINLPEDGSKRESEADVSGSVADKVAGQETSFAADTEETTIDSDTKSTKLSSEKVESISDQQDEKKVKGQRKTPLVKDHAKPPPKKEKEPDSSAKVATKSTKNGSSSATSKKGSDQNCSNRKRAAGKEKASKTAKHGEELVGRRIKVWWPKDKMYYKGVAESFSPDNKKHKIVYTDGDVEVLNMEKEEWLFDEDEEESHKKSLSDGENLDASSERHKKKKIKTSPEPTNKKGKSLSAKKRVGGTSSLRSKVTVPKPGSKKSVEMDVDETSNDEDTKDNGGSEDEKDGNSSDANSSDKSMEETPKRAGKSKEDDMETPKTSTKSRQQTAKSCIRSMGKTAKGSGSKSTPNRTGKAKAGSSSSKGKVTETGKKSQHESAKSSQSDKTKSSNSSAKAQKVETKSGNKRKRGSSKK